MLKDKLDCESTWRNYWYILISSFSTLHNGDTHGWHIGGFRLRL